MADTEEISAAEVAALKRVSPQSVTAALRAGRLPGRRVGRMWLVRRADARVWEPIGHRPKKRRE